MLQAAFCYHVVSFVRGVLKGEKKESSLLCPLMFKFKTHQPQTTQLKTGQFVKSSTTYFISEAPSLTTECTPGARLCFWVLTTGRQTGDKPLFDMES